MKTKYSNAMILLHAIQGLLILFILGTGTFILSEIPNNLDKLEAFKMHIIVGLTVTVLTLIRIVIVAKSEKLEELKVGAFRAKLIKINHISIYVVLLLVSISGIVLTKGTGIGEMAIFGAVGEIYSSFKDFPMGIAHAILTKVLMFLIAMHIVGVFSYKIKTKENTVSRMWFGTKY
jgi:cytochrome b561